MFVTLTPFNENTYTAFRRLFSAGAVRMLIMPPSKFNYLAVCSAENEMRSQQSTYWLQHICRVYISFLQVENSSTFYFTSLFLLVGLEGLL